MTAGPGFPLAALAAGPAEYKGSGVNHEGESFVGRLRVQPLLAGQGVLLHYEARIDGGEVVHAESTLMALDMHGILTLWPVMSELPGVLPHKAVLQREKACRFASGPRDDDAVFREEISIVLGEDGALTYAHAWGMPGGRFEDRSSCTLWPVDARHRH